jgi:Ni/Fe-hydrogenase subunit HybB-like protein
VTRDARRRLRRHGRLPSRRGLGRPFWNSSAVGPRFLASAFMAEPALMILDIQVVRRVTATVPLSEVTRRLVANGQSARRPSGC